MEKNNFNCSFSTHTGAAEAIKKISNVPAWWGVAFTGSAEKQGDKFTVKMGGDSFFHFTVTELVPNKRAVWLVTDCYMPWYNDKTEWKDTRLIFDVAEDNGLTTLNFTHEGLTPKSECFKDCEPGWTHWIKTSLFSYFNTGEGKLKTKKNVTYSTDIELPYSPEQVFEQLNDVAHWWPEDFDGQSSKLNDEFTFSSGEKHYSKQRITEFVPNKKVVWLTTDSIRKTDNFSWTGTTYTFELTPNGDGTTLSFTYNGPVLENEYDRLTQLCDMVIKTEFYNFITKSKTA